MGVASPYISRRQLLFVKTNYTELSTKLHANKPGKQLTLPIADRSL